MEHELLEYLLVIIFLLVLVAAILTELAPLAYAGLKVHPDRASWCIADGEMVHRHR